MEQQMIIESLEKKIANQANLIAQLTLENEELYQQFSHLMIRNNKLLKRIDDQQKIIHDLHIRIEELQLINGNMLKLNDRLRISNEVSNAERDQLQFMKGRAEDELSEVKSSVEFNH